MEDICRTARGSAQLPDPAGAELNAAVQLLNRMALAVRSVQAADLDQPVTPRPAGPGDPGAEPGPNQP